MVECIICHKEINPDKVRSDSKLCEKKVCLKKYRKNFYANYYLLHKVDIKAKVNKWKSENPNKVKEYIEKKALEKKEQKASGNETYTKPESEVNNESIPKEPEQIKQTNPEQQL